jgi:TusA-related sulfurtransferase
MNEHNTPGDTAVPHADAVLEMLGLSEADGTTCALLTPAIKARLRELSAGQVLEVRVDDPQAREDIASWSRLSGHELLAVVADSARGASELHFYLRKKSG